MVRPAKFQKKTVLTGDVIKIIVIILAFVLFAFTPSMSRAAKITFEPGSIGIAMTPGEERTLTFAANLSEASATSAYANFYVALTNGSLPRTWATRSEQVLLHGSQSSGEVKITISIPAGSQTGTYTGVIRPIGIRASERTTTEVLSLYVEVMPFQSCSSPPIISNVVAGESIVRARNKKPLTFEFSGNIASPAGCTTEKAFYSLTDEYGELDETKPLVLDESGNFSISVDVIASRRGSDKDGRLYTVTFGADNEAGTAVGGAQKIIISHDSRK
jgi:hypothetical protein